MNRRWLYKHGDQHGAESGIYLAGGDDLTDEAAKILVERYFTGHNRDVRKTKIVAHSSGGLIHSAAESHRDGEFVSFQGKRIAGDVARVGTLGLAEVGRSTSELHESSFHKSVAATFVRWLKTGSPDPGDREDLGV